MTAGDDFCLRPFARVLANSVQLGVSALPMDPEFAAEMHLGNVALNELLGIARNAIWPGEMLSAKTWAANVLFWGDSDSVIDRTLFTHRQHGL